MIKSIKNITQKRFTFDVLYVIISLLALATLIVYPADYLNITTCKFKELTGLSCPTCGVTRSFSLIVQLDFISAFKFHLIAPFLFLANSVYFVKCLSELIFQKEISFRIKNKFKLVSISVAVWFTFWLGRIFIGN